MSERDELTELPASQLAFMAAVKAGTAFKGDSRAFRAGFDAALAWKLPAKPRTVTTAAELNALPVGSVVLDSEPCVMVKGWNDGRWQIAGSLSLFDSADTEFPATVLHEGAAS